MPYSLCLFAMLLILVVCSVECLTTVSTTTREFYVAVNGSDNSTGSSPTTALRTLQAALGATRATRRASPSIPLDVVINLLPGLYPLDSTVKLDDSEYCGGGDGAGPLGTLTIRSDPAMSGKATISGGQRVVLRRSSNATRRFTATLNPDFYPQHQVWQIWRPQFGGSDDAFDVRVPLASSDTLHYLYRNTSLAGPLSINIGLSGLNLTDYIWERAYAYIYHSWTSSIGPVVGFNPNTNIVELGGSPTGYYTADGNRFRMVNLMGPESLQPDDTFFYDPVNHWLSYKAPRGAVVGNEMTVLVPRMRSVVSATNCTGLILDGVQFSHTDSFLEGCMADACDGQGASAALPVAAFHAEGTFTNVTIRNCDFSHHGVYALWLHHGCENIVLEDNTFEDLGAGGIRVGRPVSATTGGLSGLVRNVTIRHNTIRHGGFVVEAGIGILLQQARDSSISQNLIHDLYYTGISTGWTWGYAETLNQNLDVFGNHIYAIGRDRLSDMGCIYNLGRSPGTVFDNNLCHDVQSYGYGGWGLYADEGTSDVTWKNNIVYRTKAAGMHQHYGLNNLVVNNVFAFPQQLHPSENTPNGDFAGIRSSQALLGPESISSFAAVRNIVFQRNETSTLFFGSLRNSFENMTMNRNCYWSTVIAEQDLVFPTYGKNESDGSWAEWQKEGKDIDGIRADPMFVHPEEYNFFAISPSSPCIKDAGFLPISSKPVQKAGVRKY